MGEFINQQPEQTKLDNTDDLLLQRANKYYKVKAKNLLSGAIIEDTHANILAAEANGDLSVNATYYLTDKYIYLHALRIDKLSRDGSFLARNADYNGAGVYSGITTGNGFSVNATGVNLGVWTAALTPAAGDVVNWNNLHWLNKVGVVGTAPDGDPTNWEAVPNLISVSVTLVDIATYGYVSEIDAIQYFIIDDDIISREDQRGNHIAFDSENSLQNPIDIFQWGNDDVFGNFVSRNAIFTCQNNLFEIQYNNIQDSAITANMATNDFKNNALFNVGTVDYSAEASDVEDLGITSKFTGGMVHMQGNATATVIATQNVAVKILGTTIGVELVEFDLDSANNRLRYIGKAPIKVLVLASINVIKVTGVPDFKWYIAKNDVVATRSCIKRTMTNNNVVAVIQDIVDLVENDYIESWTENDTGTENILVEDLIMQLHQV